MSPAGNGTTLLSVRVHPKSRKARHESAQDGVLHVWVAAPAAEGAANKAVLRYLSDLLSLPISGITLVSGAASRSKRIRVQLTEEDVKSRLGCAG